MKFRKKTVLSLFMTFSILLTSINFPVYLYAESLDEIETAEEISNIKLDEEKITEEESEKSEYDDSEFEDNEYEDIFETNQNNFESSIDDDLEDEDIQYDYGVYSNSINQLLAEEEYEEVETVSTSNEMEALIESINFEGNVTTKKIIIDGNIELTKTLEIGENFKGVTITSSDEEAKKKLTLIGSHGMNILADSFTLSDLEIAPKDTGTKILIYVAGNGATIENNIITSACFPDEADGSTGVGIVTKRVIINGLDILNNEFKSYNDSAGRSRKHIHIENAENTDIKIEGNTFSGIVYNGSINSESSNVTITDNTFNDSGTIGLGQNHIYFYTKNRVGNPITNVEIKENTFYKQERDKNEASIRLEDTSATINNNIYKGDKNEDTNSYLGVAMFDKNMEGNCNLAEYKNNDLGYSDFYFEKGRTFPPDNENGIKYIDYYYLPSGNLKIKAVEVVDDQETEFKDIIEGNLYYPEFDNEEQPELNSLEFKIENGSSENLRLLAFDSGNYYTIKSEDLKLPEGYEVINTDELEEIEVKEYDIEYEESINEVIIKIAKKKYKVTLNFYESDNEDKAIVFEYLKINDVKYNKEDLSNLELPIGEYTVKIYDSSDKEIPLESGDFKIELDAEKPLEEFTFDFYSSDEDVEIYYDVTILFKNNGIEKKYTYSVYDSSGETIYISKDISNIKLKEGTYTIKWNSLKDGTTVSTNITVPNEDGNIFYIEDDYDIEIKTYAVKILFSNNGVSKKYRYSVYDSDGKIIHNSINTTDIKLPAGVYTIKYNSLKNNTPISINITVTDNQSKNTFRMSDNYYVSSGNSNNSNSSNTSSSSSSSNSNSSSSSSNTSTSNNDSSKKDNNNSKNTSSNKKETISVYVPNESVPKGSVEIKSETSNKFTDLDSKTSWANDSINSLVEKGILSGKDGNNYYPSDNLTRGELAVIISKIYKLETKNEKKEFSDVKEGDWVYNFVNLVVENEMFHGYEDGSFRPNNSVTREQVATVLFNAIKKLGYSYEVKSLDRPSDFNDVSKYAEESVSVLYQIGLLNGYEDGTFKPQKEITRAEIAVLIKNFIDLFKVM